MIKFILLALLLYGIYFFFFRPKEVKQKKEDKKQSQTMVECSHCGVFVSTNETFIANGQYFCSKACLKDKSCKS